MRKFRLWAVLLIAAVVICQGADVKQDAHTIRGLEEAIKGASQPHSGADASVLRRAHSARGLEDAIIMQVSIDLEEATSLYGWGRFKH